MFCRNQSSSLVHLLFSSVVDPSLVHLKRHVVSTHPCIARIALLALHICQFHVLSSQQASCQVTLATIRCRVASLVLYLRAESILRIPRSTLCNRDHCKNVITKNKVKTRAVIILPYLGGSIELIISSSLESPSAVILPPFTLGSIPTNRGASYFIKESGGETPRSDIFDQSYLKSNFFSTDGFALLKNLWRTLLSESSRFNSFYLIKCLLSVAN